MNQILARQARIEASRDDPLGGPPVVPMVPCAANLQSSGGSDDALHDPAVAAEQPQVEPSHDPAVAAEQLPPQAAPMMRFTMPVAQPTAADWSAAWGYCDPALYEWKSELGRYFCRLCWKHVDDAHLASAMHRKRAARPWFYLNDDAARFQDQDPWMSVAAPAHADPAEDWSMEAWREAETSRPMPPPHHFPEAKWERIQVQKHQARVFRHIETGAIVCKVPDGEPFFEAF